MNPWELLTKANDRAHFQSESVGICLGHMTNALIDLQSGETKATAIATLKRGLALIEERQAPMRALAAEIALAGSSVPAKHFSGDA